MMHAGDIAAADVPARRIVLDALARTIAPPERMRPSEWAARHMVVADGPRAGQLWDPRMTPQLVEIMDCLTMDDPCTRVVVRKSAQVGATTIGIAWMCWMIDQDPTQAMVIFPTQTSGRDYQRDKLGPAIDASPRVRRLVRRQTSRSSKGSTSLAKRYPGGTLMIVGANSAADLRAKTVQIQHRDEIDEWPLDLDGQGDPMEMAEARLIAYHASGKYKVLMTSTPTIKGVSRIDAAFEAGDQRYWMVRCPHCGHEQRLVFGSGERHGLKFRAAPPYEAHYVCEQGCVIEAHERAEMIRCGRWVPTNPDGQYPSFHLDALSSLLTTWDRVAEAFVAARDDPARLKTFLNLWLGEAWEERGEAPDWERLMERREEMERGTRPADALVITMAVDVQQDGLYYETVGWARDRRSWVLDAGYLDGDTADPGGEVWRRLSDVADRRYTDPWGRTWAVDVIGVDAGYRTDAVLAWTRAQGRAIALKGVYGWYKPAIGTPARPQVTRGGRRRRAARVWPVGTWPLKGDLYAMLRLTGRAAGQESDPPGYCHFPDWLDDGYFRQLTAEYIRERTVRGRTVREWVARGENHYHDCRIYNLALWSYLGCDRWTDDVWARRIAERGSPPDDDLLSPARIAAGDGVAAAAADPADATDDETVGRRGRRRRRRGGWISGMGV